MNAFRTCTSSLVWRVPVISNRCQSSAWPIGKGASSSCRFFSRTSMKNSSNNSPPAATITEFSDINNQSLVAFENSQLLRGLPRHGKGDSIITLNVGGKEFITLRSTVASNPVLAEHVARAEANLEFTCSDGKTVFIDRDPTYFPLILNHLRNKVEGLSYSSSSVSRAKAKATSKLTTATASHSSSSSYVQLPKDVKALRDIYVEATHFQIAELKNASCQATLWVNMVGAFAGGSGSNPFDVANKLFQNARRALVAFGGVGTIAITSQQDLGKLGAVLFPAWFSTTKEAKKENENATKDEKPSEPVAA